MEESEESSDKQIRFQIISDRKSHQHHLILKLNPDSTLHEARKQLNPYMLQFKSFNFLKRKRRVKIEKEETEAVINILPKAPRGIPTRIFQYKHVGYEKLKHFKYGEVTCAMVVFLWEENEVVRYSNDDIRSIISGEHVFGFSYIPSSIVSTDNFNYDKVEEICELAASGQDIMELKMLCESASQDTVSTCFTDHRQSTALHYAASNGHLQVCKYFIQLLGPEKLLIKDSNLRIPLHMALLRGQMEVVEYLLPLTTELNSKDVLGLSCKMMYRLRDENVNFLLERLEFSVLDDHIVLFFTCHALQHQNITAARRLCKIVKPIPASYFKQPLHLAAQLGDFELVDSLVNRTDADLPSHSPLDYDKNGHLPLHYACQHGHCDIIPVLFSDVITENDFQKALKLTLNWKRYGILKYLSELRSDFSLDAEIVDILTYEAEKNLSENAHDLAMVLKTNLCANQRLVSESACQNNIVFLEHLLSLDYRLDLQDELGRTALHEACQLGHLNFITLLLDQRVNCNIQDWQGSTPLHYACIKGNLDVIESLLNHPKSNCSLDIKDNKGRSALLVAAYSGNTESVIYLLQKTSCDVWIIDNNGCSLLDYMIMLRRDSVPLILDEVRRCRFQTSSDCNENATRTRSTHQKPVPKTARFQCQICSKKWRVFSWHNSFTHVCCQNGKKFLKKAKRTRSNLCDIIRLPRLSPTFQSPSYTDLIISSIKIHLIDGNNCYLERLLNLLDINISVDSISYLCGLCVKYQSIQALEMIVDLWEVPQNLLCKLLLITTLMEATTREVEQKRLKIVKLLLDLGACPNFLVDSCSKTDRLTHWLPCSQKNMDQNCIDFKSGDTFDAFLDELSMTKTAKSHSAYLPIEIAVISNDLELVRTLVDGGACVQISFALQLAIATGNEEILDYLLSVFKSFYDIYVFGNTSIFQKLYELGTLESGFLQGLCLNFSSSHLNLVLQHFPNLFNSEKLLTSTKVQEARPRLFSSKDLLIHRILYQQIENTFNHMRHLPLKVLMNMLHNSDVPFDYIWKNSTQMGAICIEGGKTIHCTCELFITATRKYFWRECEQILSSKGSDIIWRCLVSERSDCHEHVYFLNLDDDHPTSSSVIQDFISKAPLSCIGLFFKAGMSMLSSCGGGELNAIVRRLDPDSDNEDAVNDPTEALKQISRGILEKVNKRQEGLLCASKMALVLPDLLVEVLNTVFQSRHRYIQCTLKSEIAPILDSSRKYSLVMRELQISKPEVRLMKLIQKLSQEEKSYITKKKISLFTLACIFGELEILKACRSYEMHIDVYTLLDVSSAFGHLNIMDYLVSDRACIHPSTISAACQGPLSVGLDQWNLVSSRNQREAFTINTIQWIFKRIANDDGALIKQCYQVLLEDTIKLSYWKLVRWCLQNVQSQHISLQGISQYLTVALGHAPPDICQKLLKIPSFDWNSFSLKEATDILMMAAGRNDDVTEAVLYPLLSYFNFDGVDYLEQKDNHKRNIVHLICAQGRTNLIKVIIDKLIPCCTGQISNILNKPDNSNATPLFYALSNGHWELAKLLVLNGCVISLNRWASFLSRKRTYVIKTSSSFGIQKNGKGRRRSFQLACCRSCDVAETVGSNKEFFEKAYDPNQPTNQTFQKSHRDVQREMIINPLTRTQNEGEVKKLVDLMIQSLRCRTSLLNIAVVVGDRKLVSLIMSQPLKKMFFDEKYISPIIYAVSCNRNKMLEYFHNTDPGELLPSAIIRLLFNEKIMPVIGNHINESIIFANLDKSTKLKIRAELQNVISFLQKTSNVQCCEHFSSKEPIPHDLLLEFLFKRWNYRSHIISEPFLFLSCLLGDPWLFELIRTACDTDGGLQRLLTERKWERLSVIDLILIFASKEKQCRKLDNENRSRILKLSGKECSNIALDACTWNVIREKMLYGVVSSILDQLSVDDLTKINELNLMVEDAIKYDYSVFVTGICDKLKNCDFIKQHINKIICLSVLYKRFDLFSYLVNNFLPKECNFLEKVPNVTQNKNISVMECAVISGNRESVKFLVDIILHKSLAIDRKVLQTVFELAYSKGCIEIINILNGLLSSNDPMDADIYDLFCLKAAAGGHEQLCLTLFENHNINTNLKDLMGYTITHYACIYGLKNLIVKILQKTKPDVKCDLLYLIRSFGHVQLALILVKKFQMSPLKSDDLQICGWFNYHMLCNENRKTVPFSNFVYMKRKRSSLTLLNLLKNGDDMAAVSYLRAAQEKFVIEMELDYKQFPLLHLCARFNCASALRTLLCSIRVYSSKDEQSWFSRKLNGKIPIVTAIECGNEDIVLQLANNEVHEHWRNQSGESVLHIAAKKGNTAIVKTLLEGATNLLSQRDNFDLLPASTAVSMGNHHLCTLLHTGGVGDDQTHTPHTVTDFSCFHCLCDYCIGWFKGLQNGWCTSGYPQISRSIYARSKSLTGFREHKKGKNIVYWHPITKLLKWNSDQILNAALCVMGYPTIPTLGHIFVLLSKYGSINKILEYAVKKRLEQVVLLLLRDNYKLNFTKALEVAYQCVGRHMNQIVRWIHSFCCDITSPTSVNGHSILDAAYGMGNDDIAQLFEANMNNVQLSQSLLILHDLLDNISKKTQFRIVPHKFVVAKRKLSNERLSDFDIVQLLPNEVRQKIFENLSFNENGVIVYPRKIFGKAVLIETESIRMCALKLNLSEREVISVLFTKLVIGRYIQTKNSPGWRSLNHVYVKCLNEHCSGVSAEVGNDILYDNINLVRHKTSHKLLVETAELPAEVFPDPKYRQRIDEKMKEIEEQLPCFFPGHSMSIKIDWTSLDEPDDIELLTCDSYRNPLHQLKDTLSRIGQTLDDIKSIFNKETVQHFVKFLNPISTILIRHLKNKCEMNIDEPLCLDPLQIWSFTVEEECVSSACPLMSVIEKFHSLYINLSEGVKKLEPKPTRRLKFSRNRKRSSIVLEIDWSTFDTLSDIFYIFNNGITKLVSMMGSEYACMPWLSLDIRRVVIRVITSPDIVNLDHNGQTLTVSVLVQKNQNDSWETNGIDFHEFFAKLRTNKLMSLWSTKRPTVEKLLHPPLIQFEKKAYICFEAESLMKTICESPESITHPFRQYSYEMNHIGKILKDIYPSHCKMMLDTSDWCWKLGTCSAEPGLWYCITEEAAKAIDPSVPIFTLKIKRRKRLHSKIVFEETTGEVSNSLLWINSKDIALSDSECNLQILTFNKNAYYVTDPKMALKATEFFNRPIMLENKVNEDDETKENVNIVARYTCLESPWRNSPSLKSCLPGFTIFQCWMDCIRMNFNFVIEGNIQKLDEFELMDAASTIHSLKLRKIARKKTGFVILRIIEENVEHRPLVEGVEKNFIINIIKNKDNSFLERIDIGDSVIEEYDDCDVPLNYLY